jgi:thiamine biosynthesis lipoprotein
MGTSYSVKLVAPVEPSRLDETATNIRARLEELDERLSTFRETSEVSRFNADPGTDWFAVSAETVFILRQGIEVSALSGGAFDMTVGPLVDLWGFGPVGEPTRVPAQAEIDALLASTGYELLQIRASPPAVRRTRPGVQIDLSAIAKGYAVDELTVVLDNAGVDAYLVEIGGEVRARGVKTDGTAWRIAVESPVAGTRLVQSVVRLRDVAIATSGDYRNFFEHDGKRYSHTIDPRTGRPIAHDLGAASVISESAMHADAWATALLVLGPERGLEMARREGLAANLIIRSAQGVKEIHTPAFEANLIH